MYFMLELLSKRAIKEFAKDKAKKENEALKTETRVEKVKGKKPKVDVKSRSSLQS